MIYKRVMVAVKRKENICSQCFFFSINLKSKLIACKLSNMSVVQANKITKTYGRCFDFDIKRGYTYVYKLASINSNSRTI